MEINHQDIRTAIFNALPVNASNNGEITKLRDI